jgi:nicotinate-nucleotide adenylyltransferase
MSSRQSAKKRRVGVYAGTFDPVHAGHISFALQAVGTAGLDEVVFLAERQPRHKQGVEHFGHRCAMLRRAIRPHRQLSLIELTDRHFSVARTLPQLHRLFPNTEFVFLFGSDVVRHMAGWTDIEALLAQNELLIGVRSSESAESVQEALAHLPIPPKGQRIISSHTPHVSSALIRENLRRRVSAEGSLPSVSRYADQNWLYVSVSTL